MDVLPLLQPRQAGLYVRRAREAQGITRRQLSECSHVSERSLAALELGDATGIRLDKLLAVFDALGIKLLVQGECLAERGEKGASLKRTSRDQATEDPVRLTVSPFAAQEGTRNQEGCLVASDTYDQLLREVVSDMGFSVGGADGTHHEA